MCAFCDKLAGRALIGATAGANAEDEATAGLAWRAALSDGEKARALARKAATTRTWRSMVAEALGLLTRF